MFRKEVSSTLVSMLFVLIGKTIYWLMIDYKFQLSGLERGRILVNAARIIRENVEELSQNEVLDNGKPIWEAR